jgi:hypothetical protein
VSDLDKIFLTTLVNMKPRATKVTLSDLVQKHRDLITEKRSKGWTFDDIAAELTAAGIECKGSTLKHYYGKSGRAEPEPDRIGKENRSVASNGTTVVAIPPRSLETEHAALRNRNREA